MIIDLRSDTFTKPTPEMLNAMMQAVVGDDVFGEDPTVNALEQKTADLFGMDAALFCPSGTMTNQVAIKCHTQAGQEVICEQSSHVYIYEGGGIAFNSGCQVKPIEGNRGRITAAQVRSNINPDDVHKSVTRLVCVENTANRGGGSCYDHDELHEIRKLCDIHGLALHLDGARLWNAMIEKNESPLLYGKLFDSISVCLSKGLGAPVGSLLLGDQIFIRQARRYRKVLGGGMRQAGYLAAAGIYALDHHRQRLEVDHAHARVVAKILRTCAYVEEVIPVETNIVIFKTIRSLPAAKLVSDLRHEGIYAIAIDAQQVRFVFHLDITAGMCDKVIEVLQLL